MTGRGAEVALVLALAVDAGETEETTTTAITIGTNPGAKNRHRDIVIIGRLIVIVNDLKRRGDVTTEIPLPATTIAAAAIVQMTTAAATAPPRRWRDAIPNAVKNRTKNPPKSMILRLTNKPPPSPPTTTTHK
jgi:hypothetical protein